MALLGIICLYFAVFNAHAETSAIAVVYPESKGFGKVYKEIISGIEEKSMHKVLPYELTRTNTAEDTKKLMQTINAKSVIALGGRGIKAAQYLPESIPIINSAFISLPNIARYSYGISFATDPELIFDKIRSLAPSVMHVHVVYNPEKNEWLIEIAKKAAIAHGLKLHAYKATDIRTAAKHYRSIIESSKKLEDAIWLPIDTTTVSDTAILPMILKASWKNDLIICSSNPVHARKGVLFALYPDNKSLGGRLANMADQSMVDKSALATGVQPLKDLNIAVNIRTAAHLGFDFRQQQKEFDLVFPARRGR
ncbi:MAG: ABC transporter substrate binding protein [Gammaproteobacteria bacterium]